MKKVQFKGIKFKEDDIKWRAAETRAFTNGVNAMAAKVGCDESLAKEVIDLHNIEPTKMMKFGDLLIGTRFKYTDSDKVWIVFQVLDRVYVVEWGGFPKQYEAQCDFVNSDWSMDLMVEVLI